MAASTQAKLKGHFGAQASGLLARCLRDARGAASVEYVTLVGVVALAATAAFLALGVAVANDFKSCRSYVLYPIP
jgi:Flp pilus assembly pilin Flp